MRLYEWDEAKRDVNLAKHRLDFRDAGRLFDGPFTELRSGHRGEPRWLATAFLDDR